MSPESRELFTVRSRAVSAFRRFLDARGFLEVETPVLQPIYGGALARPFVTHHNELDRDLYLRIATELYLKRLIVGGLEKVYELGKDFRNEGVSYKHNPEFTMLETYEAYADYEDVMRMTEEMVAHAAQEALGTTEVEWKGETIDLKPPWRRLPLGAALAEHLGFDPFDGPAGRAAAARRPRRGRPRHGRPQDLGGARRPRAVALHRAAPDRADLPGRLPGRAVAAVTADARRPVADGALRGVRRRHGDRQRLLRAERPATSSTRGSRSRRRWVAPATPRRTRSTTTT